MAYQYLLNLARRFFSNSEITSLEELTSGNINRTFLIGITSSVGKTKFILQNINNRVFKDPEPIILNMHSVSKHIEKKRIIYNTLLSKRRWETPLIIPTIDTCGLWVKDQGQYWRAITYIDHSQNFESISSLKQSNEIGKALGIFHSLIKDFSLDNTNSNINYLHDTSYIIKSYESRYT